MFFFLGDRRGLLLFVILWMMFTAGIAVPDACDPVFARQKDAKQVLCTRVSMEMIVTIVHKFVYKKLFNGTYEEPIYLHIGVIIHLLSIPWTSQ